PCAGQERLGDDDFQDERELGPDLRLLVRREDVDDAVDRLGRGVRVQRGQREVPGLGDGERGRDRLEVAHLADQDDVRILAQRVLERRAEGLRVRADLALVDDAALVPVHELDRVLDGQDVAALFTVDLVDHRGERRALPRAGRPGHEDEVARPFGELGHDGRQLQLFELLYAERDLPDRDGNAPALAVDDPAEARQLLNPEGEVELFLLLEALLLLLRQDRVGEQERVLRGQHVIDGGVHDAAVDAKLRTLSRRQVQIARATADHLLEQGPEIDRRGLGTHVSAVSLMTSSSVVIPLATLTRPSIRSVSIPSLRAWARSSSVLAFCMMSRRISGDIAMTS